jgi:hypothetical protein
MFDTGTPLASLALVAVYDGSDNDPHPFGADYDRALMQARSLKQFPELFTDLVAQAHANLTMLAMTANGSN